MRDCICSTGDSFFYAHLHTQSDGDGGDGGGCRADVLLYDIGNTR